MSNKFRICILFIPVLIFGLVSGCTSIDRTSGEEPIVTIMNVEQQMLPWTVDDFIKEADTMVIGRVMKILPSQVEELPTRTIIYTDVIVEVEKCLFSDVESKQVCVRVETGETENMKMINEDEPVFSVGEICLLALYKPPYKRIPPDGFSDEQYYVVAGHKTGKYEVNGNDIVSYNGETMTIENIEQKVISLRK